MKNSNEFTVLWVEALYFVATDLNRQSIDHCGKRCHVKMDTTPHRLQPKHSSSSVKSDINHNALDICKYICSSLMGPVMNGSGSSCVKFHNSEPLVKNMILCKWSKWLKADSNESHSYIWALLMNSRNPQNSTKAMMHKLGSI